MCPFNLTQSLPKLFCIELLGTWILHVCVHAVLGAIASPPIYSSLTEPSTQAKLPIPIQCISSLSMSCTYALKTVLQEILWMKEEKNTKKGNESKQ